MRAALLNRITIVWVGLLSLTILSLVLIRRLGPAGADGVGPAAVMTIAFTKARFVGLDYMALRNAPWTLRLLFEAWIVIVGTAMVAVSVHAN